MGIMPLGICVYCATRLVEWRWRSDTATRWGGARTRTSSRCLYVRVLRQSKRARVDTPSQDGDEREASDEHEEPEGEDDAADETVIETAEDEDTATGGADSLMDDHAATASFANRTHGASHAEASESNTPSRTRPPDTPSDTLDTLQSASMGVIERVDMINFMCHRNLSIDLGPRINFIIGHNGSGKSAILTAITIALGGKASTTSRGSSVKDFIREGASAAEVRVHIRNRGRDAFRPDTYGERITVERRINADGNGAWKIRADNGKTISTKREELDAICDHANIQVDNPMNILTQDAARQFLGSAQAEDKYSFFLRGTQLTQLAQEYELIQTNILRMKRAMATTEDVLPDLERAAREANAKWQLVEQARAEQEKLNSLKDELVWSQVIAKEQELATAVESLERARSKLGALQRKSADDQARAEALDERITSMEQRSGECNDRERTLHEQRATEVQAIKERRAALAAIKGQEREVSQQADRVQHTIHHFQEQIDAEARKLAQDHRAVREEQEARRDSLNQQRLDSEMEQVALTERVDEMRTQQSSLDDERSALHAERNTLEEKISHLEHFVRRCEDAASNRVTAFGGRNMPRVLAAIQRERWQHPPVGPIGLHMRLKDARWAPVVESVLNDHLNAFCVTNHADRARLTALLQQHDVRVQIFTAAPDLFDYAHGEPSESILTVLRALEIDDPHITRALITSADIEKCALVRERADGDRLLRTAPKNVLRCFSMDLFRITGGPTGSSTQTLNKAQGAPRFVTDTRAQVAEAQRSLGEYRASLERVEQSLRALARREDASRAEVRRAERDLQAMRQGHRELRQQIAQVEDEMREDEPANVAALEEARNDAEEEMARIVDQFKGLEAQKEAQEAALAPHTARADTLREQIEILESERQTIQGELQAVFSERVKLRKNAEYWAAQIAAQESTIATNQASETELAQQIDEWTAQALEYCPRVETRRSAESVERQINAIEAQLAAADRESGLQLEAVVRELRAKNKAFQEAKAHLDSTRSTIQILEKAIQLRLEKWHYFRRHVAIRARTNFSMHLQNRGFSGSLHFDHNAQTLKLRVQTGDAGHGHDKDPKALSGGEKSFSTICLLLSLWEAIGCPIRCLDEFDVFMDAVNRKVSMKMIVRPTTHPDRRGKGIARRAVRAHHAAKHDGRRPRPVRTPTDPARCKCTACATPNAVAS